MIAVWSLVQAVYSGFVLVLYNCSVNVFIHTWHGNLFVDNP